MSDEISELAADKPTPEPTPMPNAFAEPQREAADYGSDPDGLDDAAADLDERRKRDSAQEEPPIVERNYVTFGGEDDGKPRPDNETIDLGRASEDLTRIRNAEVAAQHEQIDEAVKIAHDANQQQAQQEAQPQVEQQQQPAEQEQQASDEQVLQDALSRPAIRNAMEQQLQTVENSKAAVLTGRRRGF